MKIGHLKFLFLVICVLPGFDSQAQNKVITIEDMEHWPFVDQDILSAKGNYVGFTIKSEIDDPTLYIYDKQKAVDYIHQVHPHMPIFEISAKTGEGFEPWLEWLRNKVRQKAESK